MGPMLVPTSAITTAVLFLMAAFVAYMRWKVMPIR